jgi:hypothetical protein
MTNSEIKIDNAFNNRLLFADYENILQKPEYDLEAAVYKLSHIPESYKFNVFTNTTKTMAFREKFPIRKKNYNRQQTDRTILHFTLPML